MNKLNIDAAATSHRLRDRTKIPINSRYSDDNYDPKHKFRFSKIFKNLSKNQSDADNSSSSAEFYGFEEGEAIKLDRPSLPGLLPTPIVKNVREHSAFLAPDAVVSQIKIEKRDVEEEEDEEDQKTYKDEGLVSNISSVPKLACPRRPDDMAKPRTVAEKRILLQKKNDIRYLMIDNESKIFNELAKRTSNSNAKVDFSRMKVIQEQNIPFTRDTWTALSWLRTEKGKYYFQLFRIDNEVVKIGGCRGNHSKKYC